MPDRIEYCLGNTDAVDSPGATGRLCLQYCGLCHESPFLLVDGDPVVGESHDALLADLPDAEASGCPPSEDRTTDEEGDR